MLVYQRVSGISNRIASGVLKHGREVPFDKEGLFIWENHLTKWDFPLPWSKKNQRVTSIIYCQEKWPYFSHGWAESAWWANQLCGEDHLLADEEKLRELDEKVLDPWLTLPVQEPAAKQKFTLYFTVVDVIGEASPLPAILSWGLTSVNQGYSNTWYPLRGSF